MPSQYIFEAAHSSILAIPKPHLFRIPIAAIAGFFYSLLAFSLPTGQSTCFIRRIGADSNITYLRITHIFSSFRTVSLRLTELYEIFLFQDYGLFVHYDVQLPSRTRPTLNLKCIQVKESNQYDVVESVPHENVQHLPAL